MEGIHGIGVSIILKKVLQSAVNLELACCAQFHDSHQIFGGFVVTLPVLYPQHLLCGVPLSCEGLQGWKGRDLHSNRRNSSSLK